MGDKSLVSGYCFQCNRYELLKHEDGRCAEIGHCNLTIKGLTSPRYVHPLETCGEFDRKVVSDLVGGGEGGGGVGKYDQAEADAVMKSVQESWWRKNRHESYEK